MAQKSSSTNVDIVGEAAHGRQFAHLGGELLETAAHLLGRHAFALLIEEQLYADDVVDVVVDGCRDYVAVFVCQRVEPLAREAVARVETVGLLRDIGQTPRHDVVFVVYGASLDYISVLEVGAHAQRTLLQKQRRERVAVVVADDCRGGLVGVTRDTETVVAADGGRGYRVGRSLLDDKIYLTCGLVGKLPFDVEADTVRAPRSGRHGDGHEE